MKTGIIRFWSILTIVVLLATSCSSTAVVLVPKKVPPGQAKKMTGSKSAKPFAPGQQKKKH